MYKENIQVVQIGECQILREIMKTDPKQVHMTPFGLIFIQDGSSKLWEASGMPPRLQNPPENQKIWVFRVLQYFQIFSGIFLSSLNSDMPASNIPVIPPSRGIAILGGWVDTSVV